MEEREVEVVRTRGGRRHSDEFRAEVLAACEVPGALVSKVAIAYGVNVSLLYKWRQRSGRAHVADKANIQRLPTAFVPIRIEAEPACSVLPGSEACIVPIAIELQRRDITARLSWSGHDIDGVTRLLRGVLQ
jgi:transposase